MTVQFDMEEKVMAAWNVVNDLEAVLRATEGLDMSPEASDKIANLLIGLKELYDLRFNELFATFEEFVRAYYTAKNAADYPEPSKEPLGSKINRVELIDQNSRVYSNWNVKNCELSLQDDGRTLKIFIEED